MKYAAKISATFQDQPISVGLEGTVAHGFASPGIAMKQLPGFGGAIELVGKPTKPGKFKLVVDAIDSAANLYPKTYTLVVNGHEAAVNYDVGSFQFDDHTRAAKLAALESKIADKKDELAKVIAADALFNAYFGARNRAEQLANAAAAKQNELNKAIDVLAKIDRQHVTKSGLAAATAQVEVLLKAVRQLEPGANGALSQAEKDGLQLADAENKRYEVNDELTKLLEQKRNAALGSSLEKITLSAGGKTVYTAEFDQQTAQRLQEIDALRRSLVAQVDIAQKAADEGLAAARAAVDNAAAKNQEVVSAIMTRGWIRFGNSIIAGGIETLQGFSEAGPLGAFISLATHAVKETAFAEVADDLELQTEVSQQLDTQNQTRTADWPLEKASADKLVFGATIDAIKEGSETLLELPAVEHDIHLVFTTILNANYGAGTSTVQKAAAHASHQVHQAQAAVHAIEKLEHAGAAKLLAGGLGKLGTSIGISIAVEKGLHEFEGLFREQVAKTWASYVLARRAEQGQLAALHVLTTTYRQLDGMLTDLVVHERNFLEAAQNSSGFKTTLSETFQDGSDVVLRTSPEAKSFGFARAELGGQELVEHGNGTFTGTAKGLDFYGKSPRHVTLKLSLGK